MELLSLAGENTSRIRMYERASQIISTLPDAVGEIARNNGLEQIPGVGSGIAGKIQEYLSTGVIAYLEELKKDCLKVSLQS